VLSTAGREDSLYDDMKPEYDNRRRGGLVIAKSDIVAERMKR
jgi:hypothetical protein